MGRTWSLGSSTRDEVFAPGKDRMNVRAKERNDAFARYSSELLTYLVLLVGLATAFVSAYMVISTYSSLPHWDEWELVDHVAGGKPFSLAWLWAQHNEHRIPFSKLLFLADLRFFRGTQVLLLASVFLISVAHVVLLSWSLCTLGGLRGTAWRTGTGLIAFCLMSPIQQENLVWGFQVSFVLPTTMATLATLCLLLHQRCLGESRRLSCVLFLLLSITAASVATFSLANGMLLWPVLVLAAVLLRMELGTIATLFAAAVANIGTFLYGYHLPSQPTPELMIRDLPEVLKYVAFYFGSTWIHHAGGYGPVAIGVVGLSVAIIITVCALLWRKPRSLFMFQISLLILFCIGTAVLTALGRLKMGMEQATSSRYQVFALLLWCALGLSGLCWVMSNLENNRHLVFFSGLLLVLMLAFGTQVRNPLRDAGWHQIRLNSISEALLSGVNDLDELALAFPNPKLVVRDAEYLRRNRLSIFAGKQYSQFGQPLGSGYHMHSAEECSGYVASSKIFPGRTSKGARVTGYAWNRILRIPITEVVFTSDDGRIRGFGSTVTLSLSSVKPGPIADATRFGWRGYVSDIPPGSKIDIYGVVEKNSAAVCPFAWLSL
jgi:hypothetical protein